MNLAFLLACWVLRLRFTRVPARTAWLACALLAATAPALAQGWRVMVPPADQTSVAEAEFQQALAQVLRPSSVDAQLGDTVDGAQVSAGVSAGVRTRSLRQAATQPLPLTLTLSVGATAARTALSDASDAPLLLTMLSHQDYSALLPLAQSHTRVAVLLQDTAFMDQLLLIDAVLPSKRRLGVVVTPASELVLRELQRAIAADVRNWSLQLEWAPEPAALSAALRAVLARSDALILLPDAIGTNQAATLALLRAAAAGAVPVFGANAGMVRSGALAATVATPAQLARQALALGERLNNRTSPTAPMLEWARASQVHLNPNVARQLGLRLPGEEALTQHLFAAARGP